ncbi:nitroreductase A [Pasteurellaceae bacterium Macca]|nr:nitroreductase A [Pasteurellaceae bacterium Macca]
MQSKPVLETILSHRSIRKFTNQPIPSAIFNALIEAGRRTSTSNNLQCVSIIRITDPAIREGIQQASGMRYVGECAEFLLFCMDFHKHQQINPQSQLDWAEVTLIGALDTGLMAQNVLVTAESFGLGGVFIGALRNQIETVAKLVNLPSHCVPLVGLCLGYHDQDPPLKPRLPQSLMCYENHYPELDQTALANYEQEMIAYYQARSDKTFSWAETIQKALNEPVRPHILPFLQKQGFLRR